MRDLVCDVAGRMAEDLDVAAGGIEQAQQQLDGGGFAGAVRAEQAEDFAAPHLKIHVVHRPRLGPAPEILEDLGQPAHGDDDVRGRRMAGCVWRILDSVAGMEGGYAGVGANCGRAAGGGAAGGSAAAARWKCSSSSPLRTRRALLKTTISEPAMCRTAATIGLM